LVVTDATTGATATVLAGAATFTLSPAVPSGTIYSVSVTGQPAGPTESCSVTSGGGGTATGNVSNIVVTCAITTFTVGGTLTGATVGTGLTVKDTISGNIKIVPTGAAGFTITPAVNSGSAYNVTITAQPTNPTQACSVVGATGSGTVTTANVTSVTIHCITSTFTVGGTIVGYTGSGLVMKDTTNHNQVTVPQGSNTFTITPAINSGTAYTVSVLTQPSGPTENCVVTGGTGSGTVTTANVTSVTVDCAGLYVFVSNGYDGTGSIASFTITPGTGALTMIGGTPVSLTDQPVAMALDPSGLYVYVTSYGSGGDLPDIDTYGMTAGAVGALASTATLAVGDVPYSIVVDPVGANAYVGYTVPTADSFVGGYSLSAGVLASTGNYDTGAGDTPYGMALDPANKFLFETDQSYSISGGLLTAIGATGLGLAGPYSYAVYPVRLPPAGGYFYVTDNSTPPGTVNAFAYSNAGAVTTVIPTAPALASATVGVNPVSVAVDPLGRFLYVANAGDGTAVPITVSGFTIQPGTGALTSVGAALNTSGATGYSGDPVAVVVDISGQYVYVANGDLGTVSVFTINQSSGVLTGPVAPSPISTLITPGAGGPSAIAAQ
jgi:6-phosphogluconolactonase (cycloisomerase 2 family)